MTKVYADGIPLIFGFVLGLSFLLMLVAFHSIVIPIKAILLNLLSVAAAYGVLVLVFERGWFAGPLGITPSGVIESWVPLFIFTILFGLSMDYHLFILTRIKEARDRGLESRAAVAKGISVTAGVITSAASIMVVVFAVFVTLKFVFIQQLGLGLAVAVFIDATIIRSILLPASMTLLGDWNWWMPRVPRLDPAGDHRRRPGRAGGRRPTTPSQAEVGATGVIARLRALGEVFGAALRLGLTSFGGPIAHIGYFRREYVGAARLARRGRVRRPRRRSASCCPVRPAASSASRSARGGPGWPAASRRGSGSRCRRRSP